MQSRRSRAFVLGGAIIVFTIAVSAVGFWKYSHYRYGGMDLAIYTNVLHRMNRSPSLRGGARGGVGMPSDGGAWYSSIQGSSYLGDHVEPILLALAPLFRLWSDPRLLIILQALALGLTAIPIFILLRNNIRERWAVVLTVLWLLNPFIWNAALFEFHALAFAPLFLLSAAYAYLRRRFWFFFLLLFLSLSVREDVALIAVMFGAIALIDWWRKQQRSEAPAARDVARPHESAEASCQLPEAQRGEPCRVAAANCRRGIPHASEVQRPTPERPVRRAAPERKLTRSAVWVITPLLLGLAWFFLATRIAAAHSASGAYKFLVYYGWLRDVIGHPLALFHHFLSIGNLDMALGLLLPFLFLPLLRSRWLLLAIPPLLQILLAEPGGSNVVVELHYSLLFLPALVLATVETIAHMSRPRGTVPTRQKPEARNPPPEADPPWEEKPETNSKFEFLKFEHSELFRISRIEQWFASRFPLPRQFAIGLGIATYLAAAWILGPFPGIANAAIRGASADERTRAAAYDELLTKVESDASIAAGYAALPHIAARNGAYALPYAYLGVNQYAFAPYELPSDLRYLLLDQHDALTYAVQFPSVRWSAPYAAEGPARLQKIIADGRFGIIAEHNGIALLERGAATAASDGIDQRYLAPDPPVRGRLISDGLRDIVVDVER